MVWHVAVSLRLLYINIDVYFIVKHKLLDGSFSNDWFPFNNRRVNINSNSVNSSNKMKATLWIFCRIYINFHLMFILFLFSLIFSFLFSFLYECKTIFHGMLSIFVSKKTMNSPINVFPMWRHHAFITDVFFLNIKTHKIKTWFWWWFCLETHKLTLWWWCLSESVSHHRVWTVMKCLVCKTINS